MLRWPVLRIWPTFGITTMFPVDGMSGRRPTTIAVRSRFLSRPRVWTLTEAGCPSRGLARESGGPSQGLVLFVDRDCGPASRRPEGQESLRLWCLDLGTRSAVRNAGGILSPPPHQERRAFERRGDTVPRVSGAALEEIRRCTHMILNRYMLRIFLAPESKFDGGTIRFALE